MSARVEVSAELCAGHGRCYSLVEALFSADDDGWCAERGRPFHVGDDAAVESAQLAAASCPEGAIEVTLDD